MLKNLAWDRFFWALFWIITLYLLFVRLILEIIEPGMFFDGLIYSSMAMNMAEGVGDFWNPMQSLTKNSEFYDHPTLVMGLQALFFKVLGWESFLVEKVFSVVFLFLHLLTIFFFSKRIRAIFEIESKYFEPFVFFLWLMVPIVTWGAVNNLLEGPMSLIVTLIIWLQLETEQKQSWKKKLPFDVLAGLLLLLAFHAKGVTSLFPMAFPLFYQLAMKRKVCPLTLLRVGLIAVSFFLFFTVLKLYPPAGHFWQMYAENQIKRSVGTKFLDHLNLALIKIFVKQYRFLIASWVAAGIYSLIFKPRIKLGRLALLFFLVFFSATAPIILSQKQFDHYLIPGSLFLTLATALLLKDVLEDFIKRLQKFHSQAILKIGLAIFLMVPLLMVIDPPGSTNQALYQDVQKMRSHLRPRDIVLACRNLFHDWERHLNFNRYAQVSLVKDISKPTTYLVTFDGCHPDFWPQAEKLYERVELGALDQLTLWKRKVD